MALPGRALAITENYCSFPTSLSTFTLNGNAFEAQQQVIRLTTSTVNEAGSAFLSTPLTLTATSSLHAFFRFTAGPNATGGDGVAFILQSNALGASALGGDDGNLGFLGATKITPSVVVDFTTYANSGGLTAPNRVGLLTLSTTTTTVVTQATPSFTIAGGAINYAWVDYTPGSLSVYLSNTATKPATALIAHAAVNLFNQVGATAYVGFAASTGTTTGETNEHDIYELELSTDGIPCSCEGDSACSTFPATPACGSSGLCAICSATNATACTGATPVCDVATSSCVGCLTNANCAGATPICNAATLSCRACNSNNDCGGATPYCDDLAGSARLGTCVSCIADANCPPSTPRCALTSNSCVQCLSGADCGGDTPVCSGGTCTACASDADCTSTPATPACEVWGGCGQCSATNGTQCTGGDAVCDFPTGTCVACEFNSDCAGSTPTCNATTHTCDPCATNADCANNPSGPACVTSGMKVGSCVVCEVNSDCTSTAAPVCDTTANTCVQCLSNTDCSGSRPVCDTTSNLCVACQSSSDCGGATPVCNTATSTCQPCQNDYAATNPGPLSCPTAALPACEPAGSPLAGQCGVCSSVNDTQCATIPATPVCVAASATCGCTVDADCNPDSYCDTSTVATGVCTTGCRDLDGGTNNCSTGKYCTQMTGQVGACLAEPCNQNSDCTTSADPVCNTIVQPHTCVQCLNDPDCAKGLVCDPTNHCVECTSNQTQNCNPAGPGGACLAKETCGCATDADCGSATSGRVCDTSSQTCVTGCRGVGGNGCSPPLVCSSTTSAPGTCEAATASSSSSSSSSSASSSGAGGGASTSSGGVGPTIESVGCACTVARPDDGVRIAGLGSALAALALLRRRRRTGKGAPSTLAK
jgi:MYXO-CTERM domain-containing protein